MASSSLLNEVLRHSTVLADYADCDEGAIDYVIPPLRFALVEKGVYRSGYPNLGNQLFLEKLQLRSILYLCKESIRDWNRGFIERHNIQLFQLGTDGNKEPFSVVPLDTLKTALSIIIDTRNHPILIHCHKGTHRTGCLVGCLRKLQQWSLTSILSEYQRFAGAKPRLLDQQSIELFDPNIIDLDSVHLPVWLRS